MYTEILYEIKDRIARITLNRPELGNAFADASYGEVKDALEKASEDDNVACVILTGTGKHFCGGGDVKDFKERVDRGEPLGEDLIIKAGAMGRAARYCKKPVIAMINGAAAGAGLSLALACDFRVMTEKSKLVTAFINMAFPADTGLLYFLQQMVGTAKATEMAMLSAPMGGKEAFELGLCNRLAEEGALEECTLELANKLVNSPTVALGYQKQLLNEFFYDTLQAYNEKEAEYLAKCAKTEDHKEAVYAFVGKRKPEFKGR